MQDPLIHPTIVTLWWLALAAAYLVLVPVAVYWLHALWRGASSIRRYAGDGAEAAEAIERHASAIPALDGTIAVATEILAAAEAVAGKLDAAASALEARAGRS